MSDEYLDIPADAPYVVSITGEGDDYDVAVIIPALIDDEDCMTYNPMQKSYIERFDNSKRILTKQTRYNQRGAYVR